MSSYKTIATDELLPNELASELGLTANAFNQFDLMRAITRGNELIAQIQATQLIHAQNMCRLANRLESGYNADGSEKK